MKTIIAAVALAGVAVSASAEEVLFEVEYADLNLASEKGQKMLQKRIDKAARQACGFDIKTTGSNIRSREARSCVAELTAKANKQFAALSGDQRKGG